MGYTIWIGEAVIETEDGEYIVVVRGKLDPIAGMPERAVDEPTFYSSHNMRMMSGTNYNYFTAETGLAGLLFTGEGDRRCGAYVLTDSDLTTVEVAIGRLKAAHPDATPGPWDAAAPWNCNLHRLGWFRWWIGWALRNCLNPTIYIG